MDNGHRPKRHTARGKAPRNPLERVRCAECGAEVKGRIPKDGDGSALVPVWHKSEGEPCDGRLRWAAGHE